MTRTSLHRLLSPRSIAVVGASASPETAGYQFLRNLATFTGPVFAINPGGGNVPHRDAFPSLGAIGQSVDLVVICLPAEACIAALEEAASINAGAVIIAGGGFARSDSTDTARQAEILDICRRGSMRMLGPNTAGFVNTRERVDALCWPEMCDFPEGGISIIAQSSADHITITAELKKLGYGVRFAIGLGDGVDIAASELIDFLVDDEATKVVALRIEDIPAGRALYDTISRAVRHKPVVVHTVGCTDVGLISSCALKRAAFCQAGAVVVDTTGDLIDSAIALSCGRISPNSRPGIGVLTREGGPGSLLMLDQLRVAVAEFPELGPSTIARIAKLPPMTSMRNLVDPVRPGASVGDVVQAVADDPSVDLIVMYMLHEAEAIDLVTLMTSGKATIEKPIVVGNCGLAQHMAENLGSLIALPLPVFCSPERTAHAARALVEDAKGRSRLDRRGSMEMPHQRSVLGAGTINEFEAKSLLLDYDISVPRALPCSTREEALRAFDKLAKPIAVKVLNASIINKTEQGGAHCDVSTREQLLTALGSIDSIKTVTPSGYLLEETVKPGVDLTISGVNDASFGPTVMVGIAGTAAEALRDMVIRLAPLTHDEALDMLSILSERPPLNGCQGAPSLDKSAVAQAIVKIGEIISVHPEIKELDINPFRALHNGGVALNCVVLLAHP